MLSLLLKLCYYFLYIFSYHPPPCYFPDKHDTLVFEPVLSSISIEKSPLDYTVVMVKIHVADFHRMKMVPVQVSCDGQTKSEVLLQNTFYDILSHFSRANPFWCSQIWLFLLYRKIFLFMVNICINKRQLFAYSKNLNCPDKHVQIRTERLMKITFRLRLTVFR